AKPVTKSVPEPPITIAATITPTSITATIAPTSIATTVTPASIVVKTVAGIGPIPIPAHPVLVIPEVRITPDRPLVHQRISIERVGGDSVDVDICPIDPPKLTLPKIV